MGEMKTGLKDRVMHYWRPLWEKLTDYYYLEELYYGLLVFGVFINTYERILSGVMYYNGILWQIEAVFYLIFFVIVAIDIAVLIRHIVKKEILNRMLSVEVWRRFSHRTNMRISVVIAFIGLGMSSMPYSIGAYGATPWMFILGGGFALAFFHRSVEMQVLEDNLRLILTGQDLSLPNRINDNVKHDLQSMAELYRQVEASMRASVKAERMKTELITNVSHDLKTPLTSVINYTDLLQQKDLDPEEEQRYKDILQRNANRLKVLINDLVFASKTGSGNVKTKTVELEVNELVLQCYSLVDKTFKDKNLNFIYEYSHESIYVKADGDHLSRVVDNLLMNTAKYAMPGTRVYGQLDFIDEKSILTIKNISEEQLNIPVDELMERFVRGSRSRHTEGSGLGLYIAKNLVELMGGTLTLNIDGDLFTAVVTLPAEWAKGKVVRKPEAQQPKMADEAIENDIIEEKKEMDQETEMNSEATLEEQSLEGSSEVEEDEELPLPSEEEDVPRASEHLVEGQ